MYRAHFGLKKSLIDAGIAQDTAVFRSTKREPITSNLAVAFTSPDAIVTLSGTAGIGKTTLISAALRARSTRLALAWLNAMPTNATELLELLLVEFGFDAHRATRIERLQMWRQFLGEMSATDSRVFIVVERTEDFPPEVLRALDALTAADTNGCAGANVVLLGNEGLDEHLKPQLLDSLRQRIRLRQRLLPFTVAELEEYLRHHVACAGGEFERVFAPGAVAALHRYSAGIARVVKNLCETALTLAASEGQPQLTPELIATTAVGWFGFAASNTTETPSVPATVAQPAPRERSAAQPHAITTAAPAPATTHEPAPAAAPTRSEPARNHDFTATDYDFDGGATDISEVATTDFPVLTDAVETLVEPIAVLPPPAPASALTPAAATSRATPPSTAAAPSPARAPAAATRRIAPPANPLPAAASNPLPLLDEGAADELRQTQTMRAISSAKSIDDICATRTDRRLGDSARRAAAQGRYSALNAPRPD